MLAATTSQTLTKDSNSMFAAMFSGRFQLKPCEDDALCIDCDRTLFRFVLNYLLTGILTLPEGAKFLKELLEETEFYQIHGMVEDQLPSEHKLPAFIPTTAEVFEECEISSTDEEHQRVLKTWLPPSVGK